MALVTLYKTLNLVFISNFMTVSPAFCWTFQSVLSNDFVLTGVCQQLC